MRYEPKTYFVVKPRTLRQKIFSRLGFGTCTARPQMEEIEGFPPSWITAHTYIRLDWKDRLRVFVSGRLFVAQAIQTDVEVSQSVITTRTSVPAPGTSLAKAAERTPGAMERELCQ